MGRRQIPQRQLQSFLAKLEEKGATRIRRSPARFDGMVEVRWEYSPHDHQVRQALMKGWRRLTVLSFLVAILLVVIAILAAL